MTFFRKMFTSSRLTTSECYIEVKQKGGGASSGYNPDLTYDFMYN